MAANQSAPGSEQRYVIKLLLAEKCKLRAIYRRMCDVYGEECFSLQNIY